ncbi:MAG: hypothetical protein ACREQ3_08025 [Candidatus Binatia bacterium]
MTQRHLGFPIVLVLACLTVLWPAAGRSDQNTTVVQNAIQKATQRALTALLSHDPTGYIAVLHPDFTQVDSTGKISRRSEESWGFVFPQTLVTDDQQVERMQLFEAASTITSITMPSENEAIVTGEDVLRWQGRHGDDIQQVTADGHVAVIGNTEVRTVQARYRRHWVRDDKGMWRLKRSHTLSEQVMAVL